MYLRDCVCVGRERGANCLCKHKYNRKYDGNTRRKMNKNRVDLKQLKQLRIDFYFIYNLRFEADRTIVGDVILGSEPPTTSKTIASTIRLPRFSPLFEGYSRLLSRGCGPAPSCPLPGGLTGLYRLRQAPVVLLAGRELIYLVQGWG